VRPDNAAGLPSACFVGPQVTFRADAALTGCLPKAVLLDTSTVKTPASRATADGILKLTFPPSDLANPPGAWTGRFVGTWGRASSWRPVAWGGTIHAANQSVQGARRKTAVSTRRATAILTEASSGRPCCSKERGRVARAFSMMKLVTAEVVFPRVKQGDIQG